MIITLLTLPILFTLLQISFGSTIQEGKIIETILKGYNIDVRPEESHDEPLHIHFEIKLQKIVKLDVKQQLFTINSFVRMRWTDSQLKWDITKYENVNKINVGTHLIWTPDIMLYNSATEMSFSHTDLYKTKVLLFNTGEIIWTAPVTWQVSCSFDVTWFPIDRQVCSLTFGSWTYMASQLTLSFYKSETSNYGHADFSVKSGEWDIEHIKLNRRNILYDCCPEPFSTIVYEISLRRMALYYVLYIILPLISQVFLFLMIFHIPCDSGERMGFGVTILLSITVYLLVISEKLPEKSDDRPMLGLCFIVEFYVLSLALICAAIITKLSNLRSKPPSILLRLCGATKKVCCIKVNSSNDECKSMLEMVEYHSKSANKKRKDILCKSVVSITPEEEENNNRMWRNICESLDRLCFFLFLFTAILAPIIIVATLNHEMLGV